MSDFFEDPIVHIKDEGGETPVTEEKIKLGDEEFTQDELKKLVGLGKIGREAEEKFKTPIDKVWPRTQQVINENQEMRKQLEELKQSQIQNKVNQGEQLSREEIREQALQQARELGLVTRDEYQTMFKEEFAKNQAVANLLADTSVAIEKYKNDYGVDTSVDGVLKYMDENGLKNPDKAIKLMFEDKIDQVKEQKLKSIKPQGMTTNASSQAGGKLPPDTKVTKDNLDALLHDFLEGA